MSRVLEIVLSLSLEGWPVEAASRTRGTQRDFGAELVRAWRICPQVRMRRGHERVTIEPCQIEEAEASPGAIWWTWVESNAHGRRVVASRTKAFAPGVTERELFDAEHAGIVVAMPLPVPVTTTTSLPTFARAIWRKSIAVTVALVGLRPDVAATSCAPSLANGQNVPSTGDGNSSSTMRPPASAGSATSRTT